MDYEELSVLLEEEAKLHVALQCDTPCLRTVVKLSNQHHKVDTVL